MFITLFPPTYFIHPQHREYMQAVFLPPKNCHSIAGGKDGVLLTWALQAPSYRTRRINQTRFDDDDYNWKAHKKKTHVFHRGTARFQGETVSNWLTAAVYIFFQKSFHSTRCSPLARRGMHQYIKHSICCRRFLSKCHA